MTTMKNFDAMSAHAARLRDASLPDLLKQDPDRASDFALRSKALYFNFSRQSYDRHALDALFELAASRDLAGAYRRLAK